MNATKSTTRAPASMIAKLREVIGKCENGPCDPMKGMGYSDEHYAGECEQHRRQAGWRSSWVTPELRQLLAYLEGRYTAVEITAYGMGCDHGKDRKP